MACVQQLTDGPHGNSFMNLRCSTNELTHRVEFALLVEDMEVTHNVNSVEVDLDSPVVTPAFLG